MPTLEEIRVKYPTANYAPRENCRYCKGTGEKANDPKKFTVLKPPPFSPCICIYVDHDMVDFAAKSLSDTAKNIKSEMGNK